VVMNLEPLITIGLAVILLAEELLARGVRHADARCDSRPSR
jgi:hypothetical protein